MIPEDERFSHRFILDRFVLGQMLAPFLFGIMSFTVILVAGNLLFRLADLVIQRGVPLWTVVRLFIYSLPGVVVLTIPMGCLLSALLGFGGMSANSELVALKASGISFGRIVRPAVAAAAAMSLLAFTLNETIVPLSEQAASGWAAGPAARRADNPAQSRCPQPRPGPRFCRRAAADPGP